MSAEEDLAEIISGIAKEMSKAMGKMAKGINATLQKFKADLNQAFVEQFVVYKDDNYIIMENDSELIYFEELDNNKLEKINKTDIPDDIIEEVSKELL